jgi:hypothetical protein
VVRAAHMQARQPSKLLFALARPFCAAAWRSPQLTAQQLSGHALAAASSHNTCFRRLTSSAPPPQKVPTFARSILVDTLSLVRSVFTKP